MRRERALERHIRNFLAAADRGAGAMAMGALHEVGALDIVTADTHLQQLLDTAEPSPRNDPDVEYVTRSVSFLRATYEQRVAADGEWLSASGQTARAATRRSMHIGGTSASSTAQRSFDSGVYAGQLLALQCGHNRNMAQGEKDVLVQQIESVLPRDEAHEHAHAEHE